jgi:hypothetical protein
MGLKVVGVGFGRTGTNSLKLALEQLLGGRCHHMHEVLERPELVGLWTEAAAGRPDWDAVFEGDVATVDWPGAAFWRQLVVEYPDALVLLSMRESPDAWWHSVSRTILASLGLQGAPPEVQAWLDTVEGLIRSHGVDPDDEAGSKAAYVRHIADVRAAVPRARLVEWTTGDGWGPLCVALGVPVPTEPFPHVNTTAEFRERARLDGPS